MHRLHQIFVDMSSMVERQGGVVESPVEAHVARRSACVESQTCGGDILVGAGAPGRSGGGEPWSPSPIGPGVLAVVAMLVLAGFKSRRRPREV